MFVEFRAKISGTEEVRIEVSGEPEKCANEIGVFMTKAYPHLLIKEGEKQKRAK